MNTNDVGQVAGFTEAIKCVLLESRQWQKLAVEFHEKGNRQEAAVARACAEAMTDLAERMTKAVKSAVDKIEQRPS